MNSVVEIYVNFSFILEVYDVFSFLFHRGLLGAKLDDCGACTGGSTNKGWNYLKDCANTCNKAVIDNCGVCQPITSNTKQRKSFKDCNDVCFGKAKRNKCNICYDGNTNKNKSTGMDECGVCGGNGTTCKGCDGKANSGKVLDACGECLNPDEPSFNTGCTKIFNFTPRMSPVTGGREILVEGAGLTDFRNATCIFTELATYAQVSAEEVNIGELYFIGNYFQTKNIIMF